MGFILIVFGIIEYGGGRVRIGGRCCVFEGLGGRRGRGLVGLGGGE